MSWDKRSLQLAIALLLGGDFLYKDMLRVAFGLEKPQNTLFLFETKKADVALSRNILAAQGLKEKAEWIFYLDSDIIPPLNVIPRLLAHNLPIISGLYWRRYENLQPCIYKLGEDGLPKSLTDDEVSMAGSQLMEVDGVGAGCLLMHSSVFEKLKPTVEQFDLQDPVTKEVLTCSKFFEYLVHHNVNLSEDIVMSSRVRGLGYKVFCDLGIKCGHLTTVMVKDGRYRETPLTSGKEV